MKQLEWTNYSRAVLLCRFLELDPNLESVLWKARLIPGSIALWQQVALAHLASRYNREGAVLLNIGAKFGLSTVCLCLGAPKATVHTIEPVAQRAKIAARRLKRYNAKVHQVKSWDFLEKHREFYPDMVFVDGNHKEIKRDIPWFDRLRPGGLFLTHDYAAWKFPYVVDAMASLKVNQKKGQFDVLLLDDRMAGMAGLYK